MQTAPSQAAEPPHHTVGGRRGEHRKSDPGHRTDNQINPAGDLVKEFAEIVTLVGEEQRQMRGDVAERADTEHSPHVNQVTVARYPPQRRHRKRHGEKDERPKTRAVDQIVERARAMRDVASIDQCLGQRQ